MKYELVIVPPGGGEADYTVTIHDAIYIPRVGEYISLVGDEAGRRNVFRVLYVTAPESVSCWGRYRAVSKAAKLTGVALASDSARVVQQNCV